LGILIHHSSVAIAGKNRVFMGVSWGGRIAPDRDQWVNWGPMEKKLEGQAKEGMQTEVENKGE